MTIADVLAVFKEGEILTHDEIIARVRSLHPDEGEKNIRISTNRAAMTGRLSRLDPGVFTTGRYF